MTPFIEQALRERTIGLAPHYPLIHAMVHGLNAKNTFEFGAGGSTRVFVDALKGSTDGWHRSISTMAREELSATYGLSPIARWNHQQGLSEEGVRITIGELPLDLALHDGAHTASIVAGDIAWVWQHLRRFGLLLVHDTQHSACGAEMRAGLAEGLARANAKYTQTTLPYGFGLTIVRREDGEHPVLSTSSKVGSQNRTEPF